MTHEQLRALLRELYPMPPTIGDKVALAFQPFIAAMQAAAPQILKLVRSMGLSPYPGPPELRRLLRELYPPEPTP